MQGAADLSAWPWCWGRIILYAIVSRSFWVPSCGAYRTTRGSGTASTSSWRTDPSLLTFISFYDKMICLVDERKAMDAAYLDFSKDFNTISQSILLELRAFSWLLMTWTGALLVMGGKHLQRILEKKKKKWVLLCFWLDSFVHFPIVRVPDNFLI